VSLFAAGRELDRVRNEAMAEGRLHMPRSVVKGVFLKGIREYLRPGFHPSDTDHSGLVARTLAKLTKEGVIEAKTTDAVS
jgi:predicted metal-dependent hydrolase